VLSTDQLTATPVSTKSYIHLTFGTRGILVGAPILLGVGAGEHVADR